ncbi:MAG TPA: hypothetical protein PK360_14855 [bacterium]|nr:hypothetical protein [bacterium]
MPTLPISEYLRKLDQAQAMLNDVREGLLAYQAQMEQSIARGELDISEGKVTICQTPEELNQFFDSI